MSNNTQMENLAELSMEQLEALEGGSNFEDQGGQEDLEATESEQGEQVVDDATTGVQGEEEAGEEGTYIETKSGKGKIPYAELQKTRQELAEMKRKVADLESAQERPVAYQAQLPEDYQAQVASVDEERTKLKADFEQGDLTWDDYQEQLNANIQKREQLLGQALKAEIAQEMTQQQAQEAWGRAQNRFVGKAQDGIDYRADQERMDSLNLFVKVLAQDPSNEDKDFDWFLTTAHAAVLAKHGKPTAQSSEQSPSGDTQQPEPSATPTKAQTPKAPFNSLSDIPSGTPPAKSEIEALGELSGAAITNRFMNDPASIEKYLASLEP
jgi:hypothetical protein